MPDGAHRVDPKPAGFDRIANVLTEDEMFDVRRRDHTTLLSVQAAARADIKEALDLLIDAPDRLDLAVLIH